MSSPTTQLQRENFPYCGRLIVLDTGRSTTYDPFAGLSSAVAINFPSMPDSVELARTVEYMVSPNMVMPDGIHQYKWTNPLSIPITFKLHALDKKFCPQGGLSLLELTALLHSFSLPLSGTGQNTRLMVTAAQVPSTPVTKVPGSTDDQTARAQGADSSYDVTADPLASFCPPVTLRLELIFVDENKPGITCTGYVKDVSAKLFGPWLRGPGRSFNLPTAGEFGFTFVHVPGYGNDFALTTQSSFQDGFNAQAFAEDVKERLYNTRQLTLISERSYKGFGSGPFPQAPTPPPPPPASQPVTQVVDPTVFDTLQFGGG